MVAVATEDTRHVPPPQIPQHVSDKMDSWWGIFMFNEWAFKLAGVLAIVLGVLAAGNVFDRRTTSFLALVAGLSTSVTSFLGWPTRASAYKAAWRVADQSCMAYLSDPSPQSEKELTDSIFRGEDLIAIFDH